MSFKKYINEATNDGSAKEEAKRQGLQYAGYGYWTKDGKTAIAKTVNGKLEKITPKQLGGGGVKKALDQPKQNKPVQPIPMPNVQPQTNLVAKKAIPEPKSDEIKIGAPVNEPMGDLPSPVYTPKKGEPVQTEVTGDKPVPIEGKGPVPENPDYADSISNLEKNLNEIADKDSKWDRVEIDGSLDNSNIKTIETNANNELERYMDYLSPVTYALAGDYISKTTEILRDKELSHISAKDIDDMMYDSVRKLINQEIESNRQQFTDHGIRHIVGNINRQRDLMDAMTEGKQTAMDRLMGQFIMVNHDIGYTVPEVRNEKDQRKIVDATKKHQMNGAKILEEQRDKWNRNKIFNSEQYDKIVDTVLHHDDKKLDKSDPIGTTVSLSDNLSLFAKEKLPSMFSTIPGGEEILTNLGEASGIAVDEEGNKIPADEKQFEKCRKELTKLIDKNVLNENLVRDMKMAVEALNFKSPQYTLGVLAGEINNISGKKGKVIIDIEYNEFDAMLQKVFNMGQNQTKKMLEDYGFKEPYDKSEYDLGGIVTLKINGAPKPNKTKKEGKKMNESTLKSYLLEADKPKKKPVEDEQGSAVSQAHKAGYEHAGGPYWQDKSGKVVAMTRNNKLVDVSFKSPEDEAKAMGHYKGKGHADSADIDVTTGEAPSAASPSASNLAQTLTGSNIEVQSVQKALAFFGTPTPPNDTESENGRAFYVCKNMLKKFDDFAIDEKASEEEKEAMNNNIPMLLKRMYEITKVDDPKRNEHLQKIINDYNIVLGSDGKVKIMKLHADSGLQKLAQVFSPMSDDIKKYFSQFSNNLIDIPTETTNKDQVANDISTAAKPQLGLEILSSSAFDSIGKILNSKDLGLLETKFHNIYGITSDNGQFLQNGGSNSHIYLKDSFEKNMSLPNTINKMKELEISGKLEKGCSDILIAHQERMKHIVSVASGDDTQWQKDGATKMTKVANQIRLSYGKMMGDIFEKNEKVGNSLMKQMAEICAYEVETANREEVYLPVSGTFPIGDKLRIKRKDPKDDGSVEIEKVESVSVKSGSKPFPSDIHMYTRLLKKPKDRDIVGRVYNGTHDIGIRNDLLEDKGNRDWNRIFGKYLGGKSDKVKEVLKDYRKKVVDANPTRTQPSTKIKENILKLNEEYSKKIMGQITSEELESLVGKANVDACKKDPRAFVNALAFKHSLDESKGFKNVAFNHTFFIPDGGMMALEERPSKDMNEWKLQMHRFDDERGNAGATYEGEKFKSAKSKIEKASKALIKIAKDEHKGKTKFNIEEYKNSKKFTKDLGRSTNNILREYGFPAVPDRLKYEETKFRSFLNTKLIVESKEDDY